MFIAQIIAAFFGSRTATSSAVTATVLTVLDAYKLNSVLLLTAESGGTGSFIDSSSNNLTVTASGIPGQGVVSPYYAPGYYSNYFNGSTDYLRIPSNTTFDFGSGNFTVECWFYLTATGLIQAIYTPYTTPTYGQMYLGIFANDELRLYLGSATNNWNILTDTSNVIGKVTSGQWYHVAVVRNGTKFSAYLNGNGTLNVTNASALSFSNSAILIGYDTYVATSYFRGYISNLRVVKGSAVYTAAFTPPTAALQNIPGTSLLTCQSNGFVDNSVNSSTLTVTGTPQVKSFTPFAEIKSITNPTVSGLKSVYFNDSNYLTVSLSDVLKLGAGNFTVEFWFSVTSTIQYACFISTESGSGWTIVLNNAGADTGTIGVWINAVSMSTPVHATSGTKYNDGKWYHLAWVRNGTNSSLYINGISVASATISASAGTGDSGVAIIGASYYAYASRQLTGYVSNFRIVKGTAVYTGAFIPPTTELTAITGTSLLTCIGNNTLSDSSSNALTITPTGTPQIKNFSPFDATPGAAGVANTYNSTYFNGSTSLISSAMPAALGAQTFTIECWIYPTTTAGSIIFDNRPGSTNGAYLMIWYATGSYVEAYVNAGTLVKSSVGPAMNTWNHVAYVRTAGTGSIYLNGTRVASGTDNINYLENQMKLGYSAFGASVPTHYVSNFRVVLGTSVYSGTTYTVSTAPLTAISGTALLTLSGNNQMSDLSSNAVSISMTGSLRAQLQSPFTALPAYSVEFTRSSSQYLTVSNAGGQFTFGTGAFTIECWINLKTMPGGDGYPSGYYILGGGPVSSGPGFDYWIGPSTIAISLASYGTNQASGSHGMSVGNWYHVVLVRGGTSNQTVSIFVNGSRVATASGISVTADTMSTGIAISAGEPSGATGANFDAYISNYRIVKGTAVYDPTSTTLTVPTSTLTAIANTSLLTLTDQRFPFKDLSSNSLAVNPVNGPMNSLRSPFSVTAGTPAAGYGGSVRFNGSTDYMTIPYNASMVQWWDTDYTIEMWCNTLVNAHSASNGLPLQIAYGGPNEDYTDWAFGTNASGNLFFYYFNGGTVYSAVSTSTVPLNSWNHIAMVYTNSNSTLNGYVNGVRVFSVAKAGTPWGVSGRTVNIGRTQGVSYTGYISNLRIVKGTAVYTANFTPSTIPLTAIDRTALLTCSTSTVVGSTTPINQTANPAVLSTSGAPTFTAFGPFTSYTPLALGAYGGSMYFNGSSDYLSVPGSTAFNFGNGDFTIEGWIYWITGGGENTLFCVDVTGAINFFFNVSGNWGIGGRATAVHNYFGTPPTKNTWNHIAVSRSGSTIRVYINGFQTYSGSNSYSYPGGNTGIAGIPTAAGNIWGGYISNFRVVKSAVYTTNFIPSTIPVTAITNTQLLLNANNTELIDSTGNNDIIPSTSSSMVSTAQSKFGSKSIYLNGSTYLRVPNNPNLAFGTGDFTIEMWCYLTATGVNDGVFLEARSSGATSTGFVFNSRPVTGGYKLNIYTDGAGNLGATTIPYSTWTHIAVSRSSGSIRLFVNGVVDLTISKANNFSDTPAITIGSSTLYASSNITGYIDDLRITPGVARYVSNFTPVDQSTSDDPFKSATQLYLRGDAGVLTNTVTDSSANNFAVTKHGAPGQGTLSPSAVGYYSTYFNGSSVITTPADAAFQLGTGDFTIEFWINASASGTYTQVVGTQNTGTDNGAWRIGNRFNANAVYFARGNGGGFDEFSRTVNVNDGAWHHVAAVRSSGNVGLYVDGVLQGATVSIPGTCTSSNNLRIGLTPRDGSYFTGYVSNIRIVKGTALYTSTFTPSTTPLTAVSGTSLLTCYDGTMMVDQTPGSTSSTSFTITGTPRTTSWSPFVKTFDPTMAGSYYLNGSSYLRVPYTSNFDLSTGDWVMEAWFNLNSFNDNSSIVAKDTYGSNFDWNIGIFNNTTIRILTAQGTANLSATVPTMLVGVWYHVAITRSGTTTSIFLNGIPYASSNLALSNSSQNYVTIGCSSWNNPGGFINGYISNVRIVKGSRLYSLVPLNVLSTELVLVGDSSNANTTLLLNGNLQNAVLGDTIVDISANNFTITRVGTPTLDARNPFTNAGASGNSIYLNGSSYLSLTDSTNVMDLGGITASLELWIYPGSVADHTLVTKGGGAANYSTTNGIEYTFAIVSAAFTFYSNAGGTYQTLTDSITRTTNNWYHVVVATNSTTQSLYVNGIRTATRNAGITKPTTRTGVRIGIDWGSAYFIGYISNFRCIQGAGAYDASQTTITVPTAPLTAVTNTSFLLSTQTLQNNTFVDSSSNALTITRNGTPAQGSFSPYYDGYYQTYFNGSTSLISSAMPAIMGTQTFTIECWIYPTTTAGSNIFDNRPGGGNGAYLDLWYATGSHVEAMVNAGALVRSSVGPTINTWNHVAYVRTSGTGSIYLNGTRVASGTDNINYLENQMKLGYAAFGVGSPTHFVSNFRVVLGTAVYNSATYTVPTAPLTAISGTALLICQSPILRDNSTNELTLTLSGTLSIQQSQLFNRTSEYSPSTNGGSMYFNGTGDYLSSTTTAFQHTGNFTYECWVYWNGTVPSDWPIIFDTRPSNTAQSTSIACTLNPTTFRLNFYLGGTNYYWGSTALPANMWVHVAVVRSSGTVRIYQNGVLGTDTVLNSNTFSGATGIRIGANIANIGYWPGYISNFRVTNTAEYTGNFRPSLTPVTAIANTSLLLNGTNSGIIDNSSNNDVKTVGAAQLSTSIKKFGTGSIYLGGSGNYVEIASSTNLDFGTGDFTIECWVYSVSTAASYPTFMASITGWSAGASGHRFNNTGQANKFSFHLNGATPGDPFLASTNTFSFNTWYHYAITRSGNTWRMFIDGSLQSTGTYSGSYNSALGGMRLGYSTWDGANGWFNGYLDDFRITKGVARYTSSSRNFIPSTAVLTQTSQGATAATTSLLLTAQNSNLIDADLNNNFTVVGNVVTSTSIVKVGATSMYFDGSSYLITNGFPNHFSSGDFTVELWYYATSFPNNMALVDYNPVGARNAAYFTLWITSIGQPYYYTIGANRIIGISTLLNTWNHVAVVRFGTSTKMYINGVVQSTTYTDSNTYLSSANRPMIGSDSGAPGGSNFFGYIDDFRVTRAARYTANFIPQAYELAYGWKPTSTVTITPSATSVQVGSSVTFAISTSNVDNGTPLNWAVSGTFTASRLSNGIGSGSVLINGNTGTITLNINPSDGSEGSTSLILTLSSASGVVIASSPITVTDPILSTTIPASVLIVAGGGTGGIITNLRGGGGGAGGLIYIPTVNLTAGSHSVTVGAGGSSSSGTAVSKGNNSVLSINGSNLTAYGGGTGGYNDNTDNATSGGSGGGGWYPGYVGKPSTQPSSTPYSIGNVTKLFSNTGFGNAGGTSGSSQPYGAAGGGAGGAGGNFNSSGGPVGGIGKQYDISGINTYYAGGGGAAAYPYQGGTLEFAGGLGGGGKGSSLSYQTYANGSSNTGGGGGAGGSGGSGVVIIKYVDSKPALTITTGSPTITVSGGYRTYVWNGSGSFTI